jgi:hypothetical protein
MLHCFFRFIYRTYNDKGRCKPFGKFHKSKGEVANPKKLYFDITQKLESHIEDAVSRAIKVGSHNLNEHNPQMQWKHCNIEQLRIGIQLPEKYKENFDVASEGVDEGPSLKTSMFPCIFQLVVSLSIRSFLGTDRSQGSYKT